MSNAFVITAGYAAAVCCAIGSYIKDTSVLKRTHDDVSRLNALRKKVQSRYPNASPEHHAMILYSEQELYHHLILEIDGIIRDQEAYQRSIPIIRLINAPPPGRDSLRYVMWCLYYHDDADFYENFISFAEARSYFDDKN